MVGVFDSGIGGLSVLRHIREILPGERLVYVADSAHAPYGSKSADEVHDRCFAISRFLISEGATAIVVACNTATSAAVADLRNEYPHLPIVGMEPGVKPAVATTSSGVIGVLATEGTLAGGKFAALLEQHAGGAKVVPQACPGLVELVEAADLESDKARALVAGFVEPVLSAGADVLVLGCTHYPFLMPLIKSIAGPDVGIVDTGIAIAREVRRRIETERQLNDGPAEESFWTSAHPDDVIDVMRCLWRDCGMIEAVGRFPGTSLK